MQRPTADHVSHVYVSSAFRNRRGAKALADKLADIGYYITSQWHNDYDIPKALEQAQRYAIRNTVQIGKSDIFVALAPAARRVWEELGFARACGCGIYTIGIAQDHILGTLPELDYPTEEAFLRAMDWVRPLRFDKRMWEEE